MKKELIFFLLILYTSTSSLFAFTKNDAKAFVQSGQYEQAVQALESLMLKPANARDADCLKLLGQSYCMLGRYAEALPYLEQAVSVNRKSGALWYLTITRQHLYDFEGAIDALESYLPSLHSEVWTQRADSLMEECESGRRAFDHTLDVVIVDSLLVSRNNFFEHYRLGSDAGKIQTSENGLCFENQRGDHRIFRYGNGFAEQHKFQDQWDELRPLKGIGSSVFEVLDPFLLADGETLYFACDSTPGIGGFDIYRTSFDAEEGQYYAPERLGMPFNSPYDDYMMAVDEVHRVGWWATDRHAIKDSVMLYLFLFDENPPVLEDPSVSRARIDCISETWQEESGYAALLEELYDSQSSSNHVEEQSLLITITEGVQYSSIDQFQSSDARDSYSLLVSVEQQIATLQESLETARSEYRDLTSSRQESLGLKMLDDEIRLLALKQQAKRLSNEYRQKELEVLKRK